MARKWLDRTWWFLTSWYGPAAGCVLVLIAFAIWAWPTRSDFYMAADGRKWPAGDGAPRQVLWEPAQALDGLLPDDGTGSLLTPRLADGGASLYFAYRNAGGQANLYVSRLVDGRWQQATPLAAVNSAADDIGPVFSKDGRQLYFYSNRPGGQGGFDLYVARKTEAGWSAPENLGAAVNSPAHEYDPAVADDGLSLYFASNRTADMNPDPKKLGVTVRAHPGLTQFDLYVARRPALDDVWLAPEPVAELNSPLHNEGAPFLSRGFLYFASDRPARAGEAPNLDLYRARLVDEKWADVENLGPDINSPAHETEPGLSPEGFRLVFASDRDGANRLYVSSAQEVYARTEWDAHRLSAIAAHWWQILLLTLLMAALFAVVYLAHGWMLEKATAARFFLASLLLHCLLVLLLGVLEVGREIYQETVGYQVIDLAFNEDSASQPARASADLHALEQSVNQEVPRQITEAPNIPESTAPMRPTTLPVVRVPAPPDRVVLDTPAPARTEQPDSVPRRLRMQTPVLPTTDTAMKLDPVKPVVEKPTTEPIANPTRQTTTAPAPAEPTSPTRPDVPVKTAVAKIEPTTPAVVPTAKPDQPVFQRQPRAVQVARASSDRVPDVQVAPAPTGEANTPPSATQVDVARTSTTVTATDATRPNSKPSTSPAPTRRTDNLQRVAAATGEAPQEPDQDRPFGRRTLRGDPARAAAVENGPSPMPVVVAKLPGVTPLPGLDTKAPGRSSTAPTLPVETSGDVAGPSRPDDRQLRVGSLGRVASNAPPSVGRADSPYSRRGPRSQTLASMPAFFSPRADRTALVEKRGGTKESEAAVERGLDWLALHQNEDGSWSLEDFNKNCKHAKCSGAGKVHADAGATGLALLPFLAAGYTHQQGKHSRTVQRGLDWLIAQQDKNGLLERGNYRPFYGHGIATLAVCEAFAMTRDERLRGPAQKGLDFIASNQHSSGGWRYTPGQSSDTSVTGWQVMALRSGQIAGLNVPNKTLANVHKWLKSVEGNKPTGGRFGYQGPDVNPAMTAQGLLCLQMLGGTPKTDTRMIAGADYLLENLPQAGKDTSYYWYHATQVMFHMQGKHWEAWNNRFRDMLVNDQIKQGPLAGSWTPRDAREQTGGRLYSTALRLLMLEVYYSHLPIYQQLEGATSKK